MIAIMTPTATAINGERKTSINHLDPIRKESSASIIAADSSRKNSLVPPPPSIPQDIFTGIYEFQSFDDNLEEYLESLGLSGRDLGPIVRKTKLKIELKSPQNKEEKWSMTQSEYSKFSTISFLIK